MEWEESAEIDLTRTVYKKKIVTQGNRNQCRVKVMDYPTVAGGLGSASLNFTSYKTET